MVRDISILISSNRLNSEVDHLRSLVEEMKVQIKSQGSLINKLLDMLTDQSRLTELPIDEQELSSTEKKISNELEKQE